MNSLNQHYKNFMVDSKKKHKFDLGFKGLIKIIVGITRKI